MAENFSVGPPPRRRPQPQRATTPPQAKELPGWLKPWRLYLLMFGIVVLLGAGLRMCSGDSNPVNDAPTSTTPATNEENSVIDVPAAIDDLLSSGPGLADARGWLVIGRATPVSEGTLVFEAVGGYTRAGYSWFESSGAGVVAQLAPGEGTDFFGLDPQGNAYLATQTPEGTRARSLYDIPSPFGVSVPGMLYGLDIASFREIALAAGEFTPSARRPGWYEAKIPTGDPQPWVPGLLDELRRLQPATEAWIYARLDNGALTGLAFDVLDPRKFTGRAPERLVVSFGFAAGGVAPTPEIVQELFDNPPMPYSEILTLEVDENPSE